MANPLSELGRGIARVVRPGGRVTPATPEQIAEINEVMLQNALQTLRNALAEHRTMIEELSARVDQQQATLTDLTAQAAQLPGIITDRLSPRLSALQAKVDSSAATIARHHERYATHTHPQSGAAGSGLTFSKELNCLVVVELQPETADTFNRRTQPPDPAP